MEKAALLKTNRFRGQIPIALRRAFSLGRRPMLAEVRLNVRNRCPTDTGDDHAADRGARQDAYSRYGMAGSPGAGVLAC